MTTIINTKTTHLLTFYNQLLKALFFLVLILPFTGISQSLPKTINLDTDDGLFQSTVWAIEEDPVHRIWIGTPGGIQVYDGFNLTHLPDIEGTILRLQKHDSSIYCVTINALYKFNPINFSFTKVVFPHSYFYLSEFLEDGIALIDGDDSLYHFYDYSLQTISHLTAKTTMSAVNLFKLSLLGNEFYGGINGLFTGDSIMISDAYCKQYVKYSSSRAFVASHKGIIEISIKENQLIVKHHFTDLRIMHLLIDYNKNLWVATADNGIFMIHRNSLHTSFYPKIKMNDGPLSCWRFSEIDNQLYVSTPSGIVPVEQDDWQKNQVYKRTKKLACNAAVEGDGFIIIGTRSNGIYRLKDNRLEQIYFNKKYQLDNIIVQIERNKRGFLVSSKYSLIQLDKNGNFISQIITDFDDIFGYTMEFFAFPNGIMNSRTTGVVELDSDLNVVNKYNGDSVQVISMMRPYQNNWWGVSMDAGLLKLDNNSLVTIPFPDKHLFTLTNYNDKELWISGIKGIYQYLNTYTRPFKPQNGFVLKEYNQNAVYKDSLGFLYYAGVGGIQKFHPDSLTYFPESPTVILERNGEKLNPKNIYHLDFDQSRIILDIHPISISDQNYFKIEIGLGEQWKEIDQPKQMNFSLPYEESVIKVKITDLVHKSSVITNYSFYRSIPFWQKSWFIVLTIIVILLLIIGLFSFIGFLKTRRQHKHDQIRIEEQQKGLAAVIQAQEDERKRIAKDLHDGIVQQLGGLKLGLQKVFTDNETQETEKLVKILDESAKELRELSHKMMPRSLSELGLVPALEDMLENSLGNTTINYEFEHFGIIGRFNENIEIAIYRIAQELVNNVIKHSKANKVNIQLFKTANDIMLIVEDNGKGIDTTKHKEGIGLMNISSRLDTINGKVNFKPSPESGTLATIKIPIQR